MKSICIKTNNNDSINYLLENLTSLKLDNLYFSCHKFKIYNNVFIHYKGNDLPLFLRSISQILSLLILNNYEIDLIKTLLNREYFYFDNIEKEDILDNFEFSDSNKEILFNLFYKFLENNDILYLKGFITFRLKPYISSLEKSIDIAVNQYLIEKEYNELVSLLRIYVNSELSKTDLVHLIYHNENPILLDNNYNIIKCDLNLANARFLSDITFSSCDIILNTILNILPNQIYIHLIDGEVDEFINTLSLIFENRIHICRDCKICRIYKLNSKQKI